MEQNYSDLKAIFQFIAAGKLTKTKRNKAEQKKRKKKKEKELFLP